MLIEENDSQLKASAVLAICGMEVRCNCMDGELGFTGTNLYSPLYSVAKELIVTALRVICRYVGL